MPARRPQKKRTRKDTLLVQHGNLTRIARATDAPPGQPALRAVVDASQRRQSGLWVRFRLEPGELPEP